VIVIKTLQKYKPEATSKALSILFTVSEQAVMAYCYFTWELRTSGEYYDIVSQKEKQNLCQLKRDGIYDYNQKCFSEGKSELMCRDRFLAIWKFLHIVDEDDTTIDKQDKLYKVRFLLNHLIAKFQENYKPDQDLSLDEGMIPSKNRLSIKQYIRNKPVKWGLKSFMLCESKTGYVCNIEVYAGKSSGLFVPSLGSTGSVVARLTSIVQDQNYRLFMDRFYNSPSLSRYLLEKKIFSCGTVLTHRKGYPKALLKRKKDMMRGDFDFLCSNGLFAVVCCDRSPLYFISTFHDPREVTTVNRKNKDGTHIMPHNSHRNQAL